MLIDDCVDSTGQGSPGVETVQGSGAASGRSPLHQTRHALLDGAASIQEARVHAALLLSPDTKGLAAIEWRSGLGRMTLLGDPRRGTAGVIPAESEASVLLECESRGGFTIEAEERRPMVVRPREVPSGNSSSADHHNINKTYLFVSKGGPGGDDLEGGDLEPLNGPQMTSLVQAPWIDRHEQLLRPDRDLWVNRSVSNEAALGDAGWALAMVYGFEPVAVPLADVQRLLGKSAQQTQRTVDKLGFTRTKGRNAQLTVDFSRYVTEQVEEEGWYNRPGLRASRKALAAETKKRAVGRRSTAPGYAAYRIVQHREAVAVYVADPAMRELVLTAPEDVLATKLAALVEREGELPRWARDLLTACRQHHNRSELVSPLVEALDGAAPEEKDGLRRLINLRFDADVPQWLSWVAESEPVDLEAVEEAGAREEERSKQAQEVQMAWLRELVRQRTAEVEARELTAA